MRRATRATRAMLALPLLLGLQAQSVPEDCRSWAENGVYIEPIFISGIAANRPVEVADWAVVADEVALVATRGWTLGAELRIPDTEILVYPAGTPLEPDHVAHGSLCLPLAPHVDEATGRSRSAPLRGRVACLVDRDGDERYEQVDLYGADYAMHVPRARFYQSLTLPVPIRLAENPQGLAGSRRHILRRILTFPRGDTVRLVLSHAFRDRPYAATGGTFERATDGAILYRPPAPIPFPVDRGDHGYSADTGEERTVKLIDGAVVDVGGVRLRIGRHGAGWTMTPLADRFRRWIRFGCGGRSLRIGAE